MRKTQAFQQMVLGKLDIYIQKNEFGSLFHTIYKNWIRDLNIRDKTIKYLEEKIGANIFDLWFYNTKSTSKHNINWNSSKLKSAYVSKDTVKKIKRWAFPGGLAVRTQQFYCGGPGSISGLGTETPHQVAACLQQEEKGGGGGEREGGGEGGGRGGGRT